MLRASDGQVVTVCMTKDTALGRCSSLIVEAEYDEGDAECGMRPGWFVRDVSVVVGGRTRRIKASSRLRREIEEELGDAVADTWRAEKGDRDYHAQF